MTGVPSESVAVSITVRSMEKRCVTYALAPFGATAMPVLLGASLTVFSTVLVVASMKEIEPFEAA